MPGTDPCRTPIEESGVFIKRYNPFNLLQPDSRLDHSVCDVLTVFWLCVLTKVVCHI